MGSYHIIAAVLVLFVVVKEGQTLDCVVCNSIQRPDCDANPLQYSETCQGNATSCRKMEQEIYYEEDYHVRTIRQCAYESGPTKCIERTGTYRFKVFYCHCDNKDNCNGAGTLSVSLALVLFFTLVGCILKL